MIWIIKWLIGDNKPLNLCQHLYAACLDNLMNEYILHESLEARISFGRVTPHFQEFSSFVLIPWIGMQARLVDLMFIAELKFKN